MLSSNYGIALINTLYSVRTSDAGQYTCRATIKIEAIDINIGSLNITTVIVESESL